MAKDYPRSYRVADQIQRELADLLRLEIKDPRVPPNMTVAAVEVSKDLSAAKVFVSNFDLETDTQARDEAIEGLNQASGFLRKQLGSKMRLRIIPSLVFRYDVVQENAARISSLIDDAVSTNTTSPDTANENSEKSPSEEAELPVNTSPSGQQ